MRNLKRALSLTLASVMLLGMMVVGSSAASFPDVDSDEHNIEAIDVLQTVGVMVGDADTGNFRPNDNVKRSEMARIMADLMDLNYDYYTGTNPFTDMDGHWAEKYVAACYTNGIIAGRTETTYDPEATVTAVEAAAMLMRALGYFQNKDVDYEGGFVVATVRQAGKIDLFNDVATKTNDPMTRNDVAQLVLNTLKSGMVEPDNGNKIDVNLPGGGSVSIGATNYVYTTSREKYATAIYETKLENAGSGTAGLNSAPIVELGEKLYQGDLVLKDWRYSEETDDFGRPADTWTYQSKEIGTYAKETEEHLTFTAGISPKKMYDAVGKTAAEKYEWTIWLNGVKQNDFKQALLIDNQTVDSGDFFKKCGGDKALTGNGALTQIYVDGTENKVVVAITYYYPAEIYRVKSADGKIILNSLESSEWGPATTNDEFDATGFEEDEIVYYTYAQNKIQSVERAERIDGDVSKVVAYTDDENGSNFSLGDDNYKYNMTMKSNKLTTENVDNNMAGYIDGNGYVIYIDKTAVTYDYAYVLSIGSDNDKADSSNVNSTVYARLLLADGTTRTVETDVKAPEKDTFLNHIVSYSKSSSNVYSLAVKDKDDSTPASGDQEANPGSTRGTNGVKVINGTAQDIFENGKSAVKTCENGDFIANSNTVLLAVDTNGSKYFSDWSYTVYTGLKNIPDIKTNGKTNNLDDEDETNDDIATKICVAANENNVAKVIYVQNAEVSGTGDAIFVVANGGNDLTLYSGSTKYYELTAYINGEKETIKVKKDSDADTKTLIHGAHDNFNQTDGTYKNIAVNISGEKYVVPVRSMSVDNDGLVTSVRLHDEYVAGSATTASKALAGTGTGRDRTTGNEVIYLSNDARSWVNGAKLVQYDVKTESWIDSINISTTSVKKDDNNEWLAIYDDGEVVGLFIKDVPGTETDGSKTPTGTVTLTLTGTNLTAATGDVYNSSVWSADGKTEYPVASVGKSIDGISLVYNVPKGKTILVSNSAAFTVTGSFDVEGGYAEVTTAGRASVKMDNAVVLNDSDFTADAEVFTIFLKDGIELTDIQNDQAESLSTDAYSYNEDKTEYYVRAGSDVEFLYVKTKDTGYAFAAKTEKSWAPLGGASTAANAQTTAQEIDLGLPMDSDITIYGATKVSVDNDLDGTCFGLSGASDAVKPAGAAADDPATYGGTYFVRPGNKLSVDMDGQDQTKASGVIAREDGAAAEILTVAKLDPISVSDKDITLVPAFQIEKVYLDKVVAVKGRNAQEVTDWGYVATDAEISVEAGDLPVSYAGILVGGKLATNTAYGTYGRVVDTAGSDSSNWYAADDTNITVDQNLQLIGVVTVTATDSNISDIQGKDNAGEFATLVSGTVTQDQAVYVTAGMSIRVVGTVVSTKNIDVDPVVGTTKPDCTKVKGNDNDVKATATIESLLMSIEVSHDQV